MVVLFAYLVQFRSLLDSATVISSEAMTWRIKYACSVFMPFSSLAAFHHCAIEIPTRSVPQ